MREQAVVTGLGVAAAKIDRAADLLAALDDGHEPRDFDPASRRGERQSRYHDTATLMALGAATEALEEAPRADEELHDGKRGEEKDDWNDGAAPVDAGVLVGKGEREGRGKRQNEERESDDEAGGASQKAAEYSVETEIAGDVQEVVGQSLDY